MNTRATATETTYAAPISSLSTNGVHLMVDGLKKLQRTTALGQVVGRRANVAKHDRLRVATKSVLQHSAPKQHCQMRDDCATPHAYFVRIDSLMVAGGRPRAMSEMTELRVSNDLLIFVPS